MICNVTLIRLISTYLLVTYHARSVLLALGLGPESLESMRAGTDLFIVCSAFLTTHVNSRKGISAGEFLRKRLVRIVPLYWVMTTVVFVLAALFPRLMSSNLDLEEYFKSILFVPFMKDSGLVQPVIFVAWTLNLIMLFSAIYAGGLALTGARRAWLATMAFVFLLILCGEIFDPPQVPLDFYTDLLLLEFLLGLAVSRATPALLAVGPAGRYRHVAIFACGGIILLSFAAIVVRPYLWLDLHRAFAYGIPCMAMLGAAIRLEAYGVSVRGPWLEKISGYAYSIYLSHFFATAFFGLVLEKYTSRTPSVALALLLATLVTATLIGIVLHHLVEKPLIVLFDRNGMSVRERVRVAALIPVAALPHLRRGEGVPKPASRP